MIVHFNGREVEKSQVAISPDDRGFLLADGVYDVIHAYQGRLFKCAEHLERLQHGMAELRMDGCDPRGFESIAAGLLEKNGLTGAEAAIYIQVTRGSAPRT